MLRRIPTPRLAGLLLLAAFTLILACARGDPESPPSIVLVVFDTTRADAISAYGEVEGTTPVVDRLARRGVRYANAYANASWTLPSHASIFTGLLPSAHGVGWRNTTAPERLATLAELLRDTGYETFGVAENPWISSAFNMEQGFDRLDAIPPGSPGSALPDSVESWARERDPARPFFLFLNVIDPHKPYTVAETNPHLPAGVSARAARGVEQGTARYLCRAAEGSGKLSVLRGLYLNGVAAADAKLGRVLALLEDAGLDENRVTIVTSDHGEHFGEQGLVDHVVGLHEALLRVPLVVQGAPGFRPTVVEAPVQLVDLLPSILEWAGAEVPENLAGVVLPASEPQGARGHPIVAEWYDPQYNTRAGEPDTARALRRGVNHARSACRPEDRVFGTMRAIVRHPLKMITYERYEAQLYDLRADAEEHRDLARERRADVQTLTRELDRHVLETPLHQGTHEAAESVSEETLGRLRALGYVGDERAP